MFSQVQGNAATRCPMDTYKQAWVRHTHGVKRIGLFEDSCLLVYVPSWALPDVINVTLTVMQVTLNGPISVSNEWYCVRRNGYSHISNELMLTLCMSSGSLGAATKSGSFIFSLGIEVVTSLNFVGCGAMLQMGPASGKSAMYAIGTGTKSICCMPVGVVLTPLHAHSHFRSNHGMHTKLGFVLCTHGRG